MSELDRSMPRAVWRIVWRWQRIVARETRLAAVDMLLYGSSFVLTGENAHDWCQHIPISQIRLSENVNEGRT